MTEATGVPVLPTPPPAPGPTAQESRWHAYEMWAGKIVAAALTGAYATGLIPTAGPVTQAAAIVATALGYLGFAVARTRVVLS